MFIRIVAMDERIAEILHNPTQRRIQNLLMHYFTDGRENKDVGDVAIYAIALFANAVSDELCAISQINHLCRWCRLQYRHMLASLLHYRYQLPDTHDWTFDTVTDTTAVLLRAGELAETELFYDIVDTQRKTSKCSIQEDIITGLPTTALHLNSEQPSLGLAEHAIRDTRNRFITSDFTFWLPFQRPASVVWPMPSRPNGDTDMFADYVWETQPDARSASRPVLRLDVTWAGEKHFAGTLAVKWPVYPSPPSRPMKCDIRALASMPGHVIMRVEFQQTWVYTLFSCLQYSIPGKQSKELHLLDNCDGRPLPPEPVRSQSQRRVLTFVGTAR